MLKAGKRKKETCAKLSKITFAGKGQTSFCKAVEKALSKETDSDKKTKQEKNNHQQKTRSSKSPLCRPRPTSHRQSHRQVIDSRRQSKDEETSI